MSDEAEREMSDGERRLWRALRTKKFGGAKFRRDVPVGPYRAAFLCDTVRIVVEVDDHATTGVARDAARDQWFFANGYRVLLFRGDDITANLDGLLSIIETEIRSAPKRPQRPPAAPAGRAEGP